MGRLFKRLVKLPSTLASLGVEEARYNKPKPGSKQLERYPDRVATLALDNDFVKAVNSVPMASVVPYYSRRGRHHVRFWKAPEITLIEPTP